MFFSGEKGETVQLGADSQWTGWFWLESACLHGNISLRICSAFNPDRMRCLATVKRMTSCTRRSLLCCSAIMAQAVSASQILLPYRRMYRNLPLRMMGTIIRRRPRRPRLSDFGMGQFSHVQPGTLMYPDVPCTSSWCGCSCWENPRKKKRCAFHNVWPIPFGMSMYVPVLLVKNRLWNPTFASVTPNVGRSLNPIWPLGPSPLGGAAGQRGPERMAPGGTGGSSSDFLKANRFSGSLCDRSNGSHRGWKWPCRTTQRSGGADLVEDLTIFFLSDGLWWFRPANKVLANH